MRYSLISTVIKRSVGVSAALALGLGIAACGGNNESDHAAAATSDAAPDAAALQEPSAGWRKGTPNARKVAFAEVDNSKPVRIAALLGSDLNDSWHRLGTAVEEVAKARNAKVDVFDGSYDAAKQQNQFQDALASGRYDAYVVVPIDGSALVPFVKQAVAQGAKVVSAGDLPLGPRFDTIEPQVEGMVGVASVDNKAFSERLGELAVQACEGDKQCKVAWMPGAATTPGEVYETKVLREMFAKHPNIKLVAVTDGKFDADASRTAAQNLLQAQPDLDVLVTAGDQMVRGAALAFKDAGKSDQIKTIGLAASFEGLEAVKKGEQYGTTPLLLYDEGLYAADMVLRAVRGQEIANPVIDPVAVSGLPPLMTKESLKKVPEFEGQFSNR